MPGARKAGPRPGDIDHKRTHEEATAIEVNGCYRRAERLTRLIRAAELAFILGTEAPTRCDTPPEPNVAPWGIALSGGGVRSATFSLGVLQALAENGLLRCFHYQSTISGGGYVGAFLQGLIRREGFKNAFAMLASHVGRGRQQKPLLHLREYSNYLSPRKKLLSGDTLGMLGTYVRNVTLIQIQLLALMVALSLLPLGLYHYLFWLGKHDVICLAVAGICGVSGAILLKLISQRAEQRAPSGVPPLSNPLGGPPEEQPNRETLAQALAIVYLVVATVTLGSLGVWEPLVQPQPQAQTTAPLWSQVADKWFLMGAVSGCYLLVWLSWLVGAWQKRGHWSSVSRRETPPLCAHPLLRFSAATLVAALLAGPMLAALSVLMSNWFGGNILRIITFGPSCVLAVVMLTGIVHVGLAGAALTDLQREMWARVAGKAVAAVLGMGLTLAVVIYGPWLMLQVADWAAHTVAWLSIATWIFTTGAGVLAAHGQKASGAKTRTSALEVVARVAPTVFLLGLLIAISLVVHEFLWDSSAGNNETTRQYVNTLANLAARGQISIAVAFGIMLGVWALFGRFIDINEFSMNAFYRNRLVRCYLGASRDRRPEPTTNFDKEDDLTLAEVVRKKKCGGKTRPLYPLIGATLNLVDTKQLDWQDRKAASFLFSPGYCGYVPPPSHWELATAIGDKRGLFRLGKGGGLSSAMSNAITLGSATAMSGAAVSPNMGYHSSPVVTLLLTLFDARLGWWLPNPRLHCAHRRAPQMTFYGKWLLREMLGRTREESNFIYLSDGGHLENLGLYELIRRECAFILCVDGTADPDRSFADLGNAIQKCHTDFGVDIDIDVSDLRCGPDGISKRTCAVGQIHYKRFQSTNESKPDKSGILLYIKPSLVGTESADIACYASTHPDFPHESTADQYFDEKQFECYRRLGRASATLALEKVIERAKAESGTSHGFALCESDLKASFLRELQYQWIAPLKGVEEHFSRHAHVMASLFAKLRKEDRLSVLDAHLYPAWNDIARVTPRQKPDELAILPEDKDFRACFYFCQELVQLMESVYHDLDLEHAWSHPNNRGWMNAFRQWSWSPVFRLAWVSGVAMYGKPFVTFCELRLDLPALEKKQFTNIWCYRIASVVPWERLCQSLLERRRINLLEQGILASAPLAELVNGANDFRYVLLLRMKWRSIMVRHPCAINQTTLGMAVMVGDTLHVLRIQDHVRHMGLATVFMQHIVGSGIPLRKVDIRAGDYGAVGVYMPEQAKLYTERLDAMRCHAQSMA